MKQVMNWIVGHRLISYLLILGLFATFSPGLLKVKIDSSSRDLIKMDDSDVQLHEEIRGVFGEDVILSLVIKSQDIFQKNILQLILDLSDEVQGIDGVARIVSLATASNLKGAAGVLDTEALLAQVPKSPQEMASLRRDVLANEILRNEVVNDKGTVTAIHLFIEPHDDERGYVQRLVGQVQKIVDRTQSKFGDKIVIYQCGAPYINSQIFKAIENDNKMLVPVSLSVLLAMLFFFYRTLSVVVIPFVTGTVSILLTVGFMGIMGYALNPLSVIIPSLLVVMGCTEDIHMLAEYGTGISSGLQRNMAIKNMAYKCGLAILLTSLTTFLGFTTIILNTIPILHEFGVAASFGIMINFVVTILLVPHLLCWFKTDVVKIKENWIKKFEKIVLHEIVKKRKTIILLSILLFCASISASFMVEVDTDYMSWFKKDSEVIRLYKDMKKNLAGGTNFFVIVTAKSDGDIQKPEVLNNIVQLNDYLTERYDKVTGYTNFLRKMHQEMNGGSIDFYRMPKSQDLVAQYTLLLNQDDLSRFVDFELRRACILVRSDLQGSSTIKSEVRAIRGFIDKNLSKDLKYDITGEVLLLTHAADSISREMIINLAYMLGAVFIFISLLFMSPMAGLLAMAPNVMPIAVNFGVMGIFGISVGIGTFPLAIVALGIAVDDTIHLMVRYSSEVRKHDNNVSAMEATLKKELRPVLSTTVALILGFLVMMLAEFGSIVEFGILASVVMLTALISDLFITPALLLTMPLVSSWDFIMLKIDPGFAETCPLFNGLRPREMKRVAMMSQIKEFAKGERIITQGGSDRDIFVLLKGKAQVRLDGSSKIFKTIEAGEMVGEMSFLMHERRSANVFAGEDVETIVINSETLDRVCTRFPRVATKVLYNISQVLSQRLKATTLGWNNQMKKT